MNINNAFNGDKEVATLKRQLKRTQMLCKVIYEHYAYIYDIKEYIKQEQFVGAQELFDELEYDIQQMLMTAPSKGGAFTTDERAIMKGLWRVTIEDIEGKNVLTRKNTK